MNKQFRGGLYLALAAFIWGMAFSAQSEGGKYMGPFAFTAVRSLITFVTLMLFELVGTRSAKRSPQAGEAPLSASPWEW